MWPRTKLSSLVKKFLRECSYKAKLYLKFYKHYNENFHSRACTKQTNIERMNELTKQIIIENTIQYA